jgi:hypothetical protein
MTALIDRFTRKTESARKELESKQHELDQKAQKAVELQARAQRLQKDVDDAGDRLVAADAQCAAFQQRAAQLKDTLAQVWGAGPQGQRGMIPAVDYSGLVAVQAAVADFPRVRSTLESKLKTTQAALAAFERQNANFFN